MEKSTVTATRSSNVMSSSAAIGAHVRNSNGEDLGKIEDIMLDLRHGRIAYAVLSFGGFMGLGSKLFPIPWQALQLAAEDSTFLLNVDKDILKAAPGFDRDELPDFADQQWGGEIYTYYGYDPYW